MPILTAGALLVPLKMPEMKEFRALGLSYILPCVLMTITSMKSYYLLG